MFRIASRVSRLCLVFVSFVVLVHFAAPVHAASYVVNTTADSNDGSCGTPCSLRDAINDANAAAGLDTITFDANTNGTAITLTSALPQITDDLTITGNGAANTIIDGASSGWQVFNIAGGATVSLMDLAVQHGLSTLCGGGINNSGILTVANSTISGNTATLLLTGCGEGGGIYNSGTLTVTNCTLSGNSAADGGGIYAASGKTTVSNSTFSGNSASDGGAIWNAGELTVTNSTLSGNSGDSGGIFTYEGTTTLNNSIIANSTGADCLIVSSTFNASHSLIMDSANACGVTNGVNGNIVGTDPLLGSLADNGGPTQTMLPGVGSPVIDAGANALAVDANANPLATDQRGVGYPRIVGGTVDMGAVEATPPVTAIPTLSWQALAALGLILAALGLLLASKARAS